MEPTPSSNTSLDNRILSLMDRQVREYEISTNDFLNDFKALINQEKIKELENLNEFAQYNNDGYKQLPPDYIDRRIEQLKEGSA